MREIKFRLYQMLAKKMMPWEEAKKLYKLDVLDDNEENKVFSSWMQYTGLKDKNGKEIYEGDIIKSEDGVVSTIVYDEASFKSVWTHNDQLVNCILDNLFIRTLNPVVVGNIYENPELIKN